MEPDAASEKTETAALAFETVPDKTKVYLVEPDVKPIESDAAVRILGDYLRTSIGFRRTRDCILNT